MSDFDPTKNLIPYVFLNEWERHCIKNWPHGLEFYSFRQGKWCSLDKAGWIDEVVYRGKPKPVVVSNWFNVYPRGPIPQAYSTRKRADDIAGKDRIAVMRIDTCNGVSTAHLEEVSE